MMNLILGVGIFVVGYGAVSHIKALHIELARLRCGMAKKDRRLTENREYRKLLIRLRLEDAEHHKVRMRGLNAAFTEAYHEARELESENRYLKGYIEELKTRVIQ
jgi:hypothetical protein